MEGVNTCIDIYESFAPVSWRRVACDKGLGPTGLATLQPGSFRPKRVARGQRFDQLVAGASRSLFANNVRLGLLTDVTASPELESGSRSQCKN